jgi:hypothetical protein
MKIKDLASIRTVHLRQQRQLANALDSHSRGRLCTKNVLSFNLPIGGPVDPSDAQKNSQVLDFKELLKNAEFLGNLVNRPFFSGKTRQSYGYQQSYPQYLGVSFVFYINQGLSELFGVETCKSWAEPSNRTVQPYPARAQGVVLG